MTKIEVFFVKDSNVNNLPNIRLNRRGSQNDHSIKFATRSSTWANYGFYDPTLTLNRYHEIEIRYQSVIQSTGLSIYFDGVHKKNLGPITFDKKGVNMSIFAGYGSQVAENIVIKDLEYG